jgi:hypothetical protein
MKIDMCSDVQRKKMLAMIKIADAFLQTIKEAGPEGAPSGPMYMAAQTYGMSLEQYLQIMSLLVDAGRIRLSNHCYYYVNQPAKEA